MGTERYTVTDEDSEALDVLIHRDDLTHWEEEFLESLEEAEVGSGKWTPNQKKTFDELFERKMCGGGRVR